MASPAKPPRERMVHQATQKLRAGGLSAASMRHVAEAARAPRGSLQHYFPDGKDQLIEEALRWAGAYAAGYVQRYLDATDRPTASGVLGCIVDYWVAELRRTDFELGCPMVGAIAGGLATERTRAAAQATLRTWSTPIADGLTRAGIDPSQTAPLAEVALSAVEGAILLGRIERSTAALENVRAVLGACLDQHPLAHLASKEEHA